MASLKKTIKASILLAVAVILSGCLSSLLGINSGNQQNPYQQQAYWRQGQSNQQGGLYQQGSLNQMGTLNQQNQGLLGQQNQEQAQKPSVPPGYSESGYQPGYPARLKPSFQGWTDPDSVIWDW